MSRIFPIFGNALWSCETASAAIGAALFRLPLARDPLRHELRPALPRAQPRRIRFPEARHAEPFQLAFERRIGIRQPVIEHQPLQVVPELVPYDVHVVYPPAAQADNFNQAVINAGHVSAARHVHSRIHPDVEGFGQIPAHFGRIRKPRKPAGVFVELHPLGQLRFVRNLSQNPALFYSPLFFGFRSLFVSRRGITENRFDRFRRLSRGLLARNPSGSVSVVFSLPDLVFRVFPGIGKKVQVFPLTFGIVFRW